jgi:hypothetical protein
MFPFYQPSFFVLYSPGMGNIWYRNNEYFSLMGVTRNKIIFPHQNPQMLLPNRWDLNYFVLIAISFAVGTAIKRNPPSWDVDISMQMVIVSHAQRVF